MPTGSAVNEPQVREITTLHVFMRSHEHAQNDCCGFQRQPEPHRPDNI